MNVLCIGHSSYDISCPIEGYPIENQKYRLAEKVENGGGAAANTAYLLAKWGIETYLATAVGNDTYGAKIRKEYEIDGIKANFIETIYDQNTSLTFILINKLNGSRTLFNITGNDNSPHLKNSDINIEPDYLFIDGYEYATSLNVLNKYPQKISIIDAEKITPEILDLCKLCKYIICSKDFAETITNIKIDFQNSLTLLNVYNSLKRKYPQGEIIITLEEKGALYTYNNQIKIMPGIKTICKDTTGAGDIFHGAFIYGLMMKYEMEKIITLANIAAGLSCQNIGCRQSTPSLNDVLKYYDNKNQGVIANGNNPK